MLAQRGYADRNKYGNNEQLALNLSGLKAAKEKLPFLSTGTTSKSPEAPNGSCDNKPAAPLSAPFAPRGHSFSSILSAARLPLLEKSSLLLFGGAAVINDGSEGCKSVVQSLDLQGNGCFKKQ